jgi:hypothetical protein
MIENNMMAALVNNLLRQITSLENRNIALQKEANYYRRVEFLEAREKNLVEWLR